MPSPSAADPSAPSGSAAVITSRTWPSTTSCSAAGTASVVSPAPVRAAPSRGEQRRAGLAARSRDHEHVTVACPCGRRAARGGSSATDVRRLQQHRARADGRDGRGGDADVDDRRAAPAWSTPGMDAQADLRRSRRSRSRSRGRRCRAVAPCRPTGPTAMSTARIGAPLAFMASIAARREARDGRVQAGAEERVDDRARRDPAAARAPRRPPRRASALDARRRRARHAASMRAASPRTVVRRGRPATPRPATRGAPQMARDDEAVAAVVAPAAARRRPARARGRAARAAPGRRPRRRAPSASRPGVPCSIVQRSSARISSAVVTIIAPARASRISRTAASMPDQHGARDDAVSDVELDDAAAAPRPAARCRRSGRARR